MEKKCFCFILTVFALVRVLLMLQHVPTVQSAFKGAVLVQFFIMELHFPIN